MIKKIFVALGVLVGLLLAAIVLLALLLRHPAPEAIAGPDGDALAKKVAAAVGADAWNQLGVVRWTLDGKRHFLWDKRRGFVRVRIGGDETLLDLVKMDGRAFHDGDERSGDARKKQLDAAYKWFCNDSFWLNPLVKLFDGGTSRAALTVDGKPALLVSYASGGVTPGDKYLWLLDGNGMPRAWRVWASVLKLVPGIEFSWQDWTSIGGARIATNHRVAVLGARVQPVSDLASGEKPEDVEPGPDPFAGLASKR